MAKKNKKQAHKKKRAEARKLQKAKVRAQPKLFRKDPVLKDALDHRHRLVTCLINEEWQEYKFAHVYVIRDSPFGLVLVSFLIDLAEVGLKDAWGGYGYNEADIEDLRSNSLADDSTLVPCDLLLVIDLVHGGILWSQKWNYKLPKDYKVWLRLLPPVDPNHINLDLFGEDGKPIFIMDEDDLDRAIEQEVDPELLKNNLVVDENGLPAATLNIIGDIKSALVGFSHRSEFIEALEIAVKIRFGDKDPESDFEWINFQDWFILENDLEDGKTIVQRFSEHFKKFLSNDVRQLLQGWGFVIDGLFEVLDCDHDRSRMRNLINERDYTVYATSNMSNADIKPGDFLYARIVPVLGDHVFSGAVSVIKGDRSLKQRATIYKTAVEWQMKNPAKAFRDNDEKLQKSRDQVRRQYEDYMNVFGEDQVFGNGREIYQLYQSFFDFQVFEKVNPETGLTPAAHYEQDTGKPYKSPIAHLPDDVIASEDVAMLCDTDEGILFLIQYRQFIDIFKNPDAYLGRVEAEDLVMEYLESDAVSDIPFRKAAKRFPDNFTAVMEYMGKQHDFESVDIEDLMREFKPQTFNKLPTTVAILHSEMTELAQMADKELQSESDRLKKMWKKIKGDKDK
jgi:hypothetical protein